MSEARATYAEIRKHPRLEKKIRGDYRIILPMREDEDSPLQTETISGGGLMFNSSRPIPEGSHLEFRLYTREQVVEFTARTVWSRKEARSGTGHDRYATGMQFTIITQEDITRLLTD